MNSNLISLLNGDYRQFKRWSKRRVNSYALELLNKIIDYEIINNNEIDFTNIKGEDFPLINIIKFVVAVDGNIDLNLIRLNKINENATNECIKIIQKFRGNSAAIKFYLKIQDDHGNLGYINHELISAISFYGKDFTTTRFALKMMASINL